MSDTESDIEEIPHDETVKKLQVPEFQDSPTSSGGNLFINIPCAIVSLVGKLSQTSDLTFELFYIYQKVDIY